MLRNLLHPYTSLLTQSSAVTAVDNLTSGQQSRLGVLLKHKLRGIPSGHLPSLTLTDVLHVTLRTHLPHIPHDINLAWFLHNRARIDQFEHDRAPRTADYCPEEGELSYKIFRSVWYYRLDHIKQFQRWHDDVRWNIAIYTAVLTALNLKVRKAPNFEHENDREAQRHVRSQNKLSFSISPAAVKFMTMYLTAVLEQHNAPTKFEKRERFIRMHCTGDLDLFVIHKSWAKKAFQKDMKRLSREWGIELSRARRDMGMEVYESKVDSFVGSLIPGRLDQHPTSTASAQAKRGDGERDADEGIANTGVTEMLDALCMPCPTLAQQSKKPKTANNEEHAMLCDLRTALTCVQNTRPRDMLPVLMRIFPPSENDSRA